MLIQRTKPYIIAPFYINVPFYIAVMLTFIMLSGCVSYKKYDKAPNDSVKACVNSGGVWDSYYKKCKTVEGDVKGQKSGWKEAVDEIVKKKKH